MDGQAGSRAGRWRGALVLASALGLAACGKRGDPLPPLPVTPQPVTNLRLAQRGNTIEITYVAPRATTGGARLGVLEIEILRADVAKESLRTPAEIQKAAADFQKLSRRSRQKAAPGEALTETAPLPPPGTIVRVAARALDRGRASTLSSVATLTVQPPPAAPSELVAELSGDAVALRWAGTVPSPPPSPSPSPPPSPATSASPRSSPTPSPTGTTPSPAVPSPGPSAAPSGVPTPHPSPSPSATPAPPTRGFLIYRRGVTETYRAPIRSEPFTTNAFEDRAISLGQRWCYVVGTAVSTEPVVESARSNEVCIDVRDIVPPAAPSGVAALGGPDGVEVSWSPSSEPDLASYRVYREVPGGGRERVGEVAPPETSLRDATAAPGTRYTYSVTAVDRAGNESKPSGPAPGGRP